MFIGICHHAFFVPFILLDISSSLPIIPEDRCTTEWSGERTSQLAVSPTIRDAACIATGTGNKIVEIFNSDGQPAPTVPTHTCNKTTPIASPSSLSSPAAPVTVAAAAHHYDIGNKASGIDQHKFRVPRLPSQTIQVTRLSAVGTGSDAKTHPPIDHSKVSNTPAKLAISGDDNDADITIQIDDDNNLYIISGDPSQPLPFDPDDLDDEEDPAIPLRGPGNEPFFCIPSYLPGGGCHDHRSEEEKASDWKKTKIVVGTVLGLILGTFVLVLSLLCWLGCREAGKRVENERCRIDQEQVDLRMVKNEVKDLVDEDSCAACKLRSNTWTSTIDDEATDDETEGSTEQRMDSNPHGCHSGDEARCEMFKVSRASRKDNLKYSRGRECRCSGLNSKGTDKRASVVKKRSRPHQHRQYHRRDDADFDQFLWPSNTTSDDHKSVNKKDGRSKSKTEEVNKVDIDINMVGYGREDENEEEKARGKYDDDDNDGFLLDNLEERRGRAIQRVREAKRQEIDEKVQNAAGRKKQKEKGLF